MDIVQDVKTEAEKLEAEAKKLEEEAKKLMGMTPETPPVNPAPVVP